MIGRAPSFDAISTDECIADVENLSRIGTLKGNNTTPFKRKFGQSAIGQVEYYRWNEKLYSHSQADLPGLYEVESSYYLLMLGRLAVPSLNAKHLLKGPTGCHMPHTAYRMPHYPACFHQHFRKDGSGVQRLRND